MQRRFQNHDGCSTTTSIYCTTSNGTLWPKRCPTMERANCGIASEVFADDFSLVMVKSPTELNDEFNHFAKLTIQNGRLSIGPSIRRNVKAFVQWGRDKIWMGRDPSTTPFPVADAIMLTNRMKMHDDYVAQAKLYSEQSKPRPFRNETNWDDWNVTFVAYLRLLPGTNGVPLSYVVREDSAPDPTPHPDYLDMYIQMAPHNGNAYIADSLTVLTLLNGLIIGNEDAEGAVSSVNTTSDGRAAYLGVKEQYEGRGMMQNKVQKAETTLAELFYSGEKKPHMWWTKFETELTKAYATIDNRAPRVVFDDEQKLRKLQKMVAADFLKDHKAVVDAEIARVPMN